MSEWIETTLTDYCDAVKDGTHDSPKKQETGKLLVTSKNIKGSRLDLSTAYNISEDDFNAVNKRSKVNRLDVLLSMIGTVGEVCVIEDDPDFAIKNVGLLKCSKEMQSYWLYYYLLSADAQQKIKERLRGTTQQYLPLGEIRNFPIRYPKDPKVTKSIIDILKSLDDKIENNRRMNETLEGMAQAIFKSWFVDFDPVHAKAKSLKNGGSEDDARLAAMCAISGKTAEALAQLKSENPDDYAQLAIIADAFPSDFTTSDLGYIPEGWEVKNISDFGKVICGKTPSKSNKEYYGSDVPFIKIPDMHSNVFATQTTDSLSAKGAQSQKNKFIPKGSICVSCIATVGKVVIASQESQTNQQINSIIPDKAEYSYFLFFAMKSFEKVFHDLASGGSATLNMNTSTFSKVQLIKPEENILEIYYFCIERTMDKILQNDLENQSLAETRNALLPKLLSGEIGIGNIVLER